MNGQIVSRKVALRTMLTKNLSLVTGRSDRGPQEVIKTGRKNEEETYETRTKD